MKDIDVTQYMDYIKVQPENIQSKSDLKLDSLQQVEVTRIKDFSRVLMMNRKNEL